MTLKDAMARFSLFFRSRSTKTAPRFQTRVKAMGFICCALMVLILLRYAWITFFPTSLRTKLIETGSRQFETSITLATPRTTITDRNGRVLAVSIPRPSLFLLTRKMPTDPVVLKKVAEQIQIPLKTLLAYSTEKRKFIWLKRQMTRAEFQKMGSLKKWQDFLGVVNEPKRVYPEKDIASQLIGFVGADGNGLEGVEKIYNSTLNIKPTKADVIRDARGRLVMVTPNEASKPEQKTPTLRLSIDLSIQEIAQNALKEGVIKAKAKGGSAIVMDVKTGELLAIASYPTYDLNHPPQNDPEARRFRPVMDAIELGSVVKPMWVAKGLDLDVITPETKIFAENGKMALPGGVIHDTKPHGWLTPEEILKFSSNIGVYKVVQKIGRERFYDALMKIGFGRQPGTGLPGEWGGRIRPIESWREMNFANMAFGQGFAISPLQLIHGLSIIVGGGIDHGVNLLAVDKTRKVVETVGPPLEFIRPETSSLVSRMMEAALEEEGGTGARARIPGVLVAGKSGTAQIWSVKTNSYSDLTVLFEGIFPADDPKIAIVVVLDRSGIHRAFGGVLAAPVFAEIGKGAVRYLNSQGVLTFDHYENKYLKKESKKTVQPNSSVPKKAQ